MSFEQTKKINGNDSASLILGHYFAGRDGNDLKSPIPNVAQALNDRMRSGLLEIAVINTKTV